MTKEDYEVVENMEKYGGGFVKALAVCFYRADHNNFLILKSSFKKYWEEYKNFKK